MNTLPKTVARQRRGCNLNPGPSAPESSTLATRLPGHIVSLEICHKISGREAANKHVTYQFKPMGKQGRMAGERDRGPRTFAVPTKLTCEILPSRRESADEVATPVCNDFVPE